MYVESLKISGFTSFKDVEWKPGRLNVLIGPNGSGKSNLLRILELVSVSADGHLRDFILGRGGFPQLRWGGSAREMVLLMHTRPTPITYQFVLEAVPGSASHRIESEMLAFEDEFAAGYRLLDRTVDQLLIWEGDNTVPVDPSRNPPEAETALSTVSALWPHPTPYEFQQYLKAWAVHRDLRVDEETGLRRSAANRKETRIAYNGHNLIPVLNTLYATDTRETIDNSMAAAFPDDYGELVFRDTEPGRVQMYVRRKHSKREDSAMDLSDGTLRYLLLVAILATPDPPPLIAIDEPEVGLHPSMLPLVAELAAEAAERTQVILSTHSSELLDAFDEDLPFTTVFKWEEDHTELKTIGGDELKNWVKNYSLSRFAFSGEANLVL
jgi:predicted ATPase